MTNTNVNVNTNEVAALGVTKAAYGGNEYVVSSAWSKNEIIAALSGIGVQVDPNATTKIENDTLIFEGAAQPQVQNFGTKGSESLGVTKANVGGNEYVISSAWTLEEITSALAGIGVQVDPDATTRIEGDTLIFEGTTQPQVQNFGTKGY